MKISIAGGGRVATAFALALAPRRRGVGLSAIWCRRPGRSRALSRRCGLTAGAAATPLAAIARADVLLICVSDGAIGTVSRALAAGDLRGKIVLHASGALGAAPLRDARAAGAAVGLLHPLAAFPPATSRAPAAIFDRSLGFTIDGDPAAARAARRIVARLGGFPLPAPVRRDVYHAAAVLLANHVTVLAATGLDLLARRAGLRGPAVLRAFATLIRTAADGIEREGALGALTGPASRGDVATLRRHLAALRGESAAVRRLYRDLSREAARLSALRGTLSRGSLASVLAALGPTSRRAR